MPRPSLGLAARVIILGAIVFLEKIYLNRFVDFDRAQAAQGFGALVRNAQHLGLRGLVAFAAALALFTYVRGGAALEDADRAMRLAPIRIRWAAAHLLCAACLVPLSFLLYRDEASPLPLPAVVALWLAVAGAGAVFAAAALGPLDLWKRAARSLGSLWAYAGVVAVLSAAAFQLSQQLWAPTANLTFNLVRAVLSRILPDLTGDPTTHVLRTPTFAIEVSEICSGLEGVGMILAFMGGWLIYFRREYIFPRAFLLVPVGVAAIFALNIVRLSVLVLIGNAGFHDVAVYGFHSQAGWIAFICVACGLVLLSRRSTWLNRTAVHVPRGAVTHNPTAAFLMPLLAILAAGAVAHALSSDFEFLYLLRVIAGAWMLLRYRRTLAAAMSWTWSWRGVAVGAAVFVIWIGAAHFVSHPAAMPAKLAALPRAWRWAWVALRIVGSVLIVPFAEEVAFRGYLMRRLVSAEFEAVPFRAVGFIPLALTSIVFGMSHGSMWAAGIAAGLGYGLLVIRRASLGEAVAAHLVSNALVAAAVLVGGQWQLW